MKSESYRQIASRQFSTNRERISGLPSCKKHTLEPSKAISIGFANFLFCKSCQVIRGIAGSNRKTMAQTGGVYGRTRFIWKLRSSGSSHSNRVNCACELVASHSSRNAALNCSHPSEATLSSVSWVRLSRTFSSYSIRSRKASRSDSADIMVYNLSGFTRSTMLLTITAAKDCGSSEPLSEGHKAAILFPSGRATR